MPDEARRDLLVDAKSVNGFDGSAEAWAGLLEGTRHLPPCVSYATEVQEALSALRILQIKEADAKKRAEGKARSKVKVSTLTAQPNAKQDGHQQQQPLQPQQQQQQQVRKVLQVEI